MCVLALASIADGWSKVEWGATSPHKKNRYIQELKRAYPVARLSTSDPFALALAFVYERLDEKFEALAILDKITTESNISSDLVKLAWRRWVKLHMKSFREETAKGNVSAANKALLTAKNGFYSAEVDDKSEENIPTDPTELDNKWYFEGIKDFGLSSPTMLESAGELYNKNVGAVTPTKETKPEPIQPIRPTTSNIQSSYRVLKIGDIVLTYVPGSKVNIDHAESRAAYRFDKKRAESLDDNFLSEDGLTIPSLNLTMKDLGNDRVRILILGSGFSVDFFKDAPAADVP
jgi:hypothetical protein